MNLLAIDPGVSGGIAWTDYDGQVQVIPMPEIMTEQVDALRSIIAEMRPIERPGVKCFMEKVGMHRKGNSASSSVKFARHCGNLETILYMISVSTEQVSPQKWQKMFTLPKDKKQRKNAIKEQMARLYPHLKVTLKTADALAILTYAMKQK
jgi:hypothetical protein